MIASGAAEASSNGDLHLLVDEHSVDVGERHVNSKGKSVATQVRTEANAVHHFSAHGRRTTSNAQVDRCC